MNGGRFPGSLCPIPVPRLQPVPWPPPLWGFPHGSERVELLRNCPPTAAGGEAGTLSGVGGPYLNLSSARFPLGSRPVFAGSVPASVKWGDNLYLSGSLRLHEMIPVVSAWHMAITPQVVTSRMITRKKRLPSLWEKPEMLSRGTEESFLGSLCIWEERRQEVTAES